MGNICRSPAAEGFFRHILAGSELADRIDADSAGTHGYHVGQAPDRRAVAAASRYGVDLTGITARRIQASDFGRFDLIVAMDEGNLQQLEWMCANEAEGQGRPELRLMMEFSPQFPGVREVMDPYYGGMRDFDAMCALLQEATQGLLEATRQRLQGDPTAGRER